MRPREIQDQREHRPDARHARIAIAVILFVYVLWMRTFDVATTFLMLGEQTRDWKIALGGLTDLPLLGAPSTAGGRGLGPAYYWTLWLGRIMVGPFMDNLPHAGGVIVALLQSIGDVWLFLALSRRVHWGLAAATCLLVASGPFDIAISSVIWNPPVADAFLKMAIASALSLDTPIATWQVARTTALAWIAVQCHLSAAFPASAIVAAVVLQSLVDRSVNGLRTFYIRAAAALAVVLVLQVPFLISALTQPGAPAGPSAAIANITSGRAFRPFFGLDTVTGVAGNLFLPMSDTFKFWIPSVICGAIVIARYRRDLIVIGASIGGILVASIVFSTWTRSYDGYWFLAMTTGLALTFAFTIAAIPNARAVQWIGIALLAWFASWQPSRIDSSQRYFEYPQYGTMVRGSRALMARAPVVRDVRVSFDVHPTMDRQFIYKTLGGRIESTARYTATINADGSVRLDE